MIECAALFIPGGPKQKQPNCPSIDDWKNKMWYMYTLEYYLAIRKHKMPPFETNTVI